MKVFKSFKEFASAVNEEGEVSKALKDRQEQEKKDLANKQFDDAQQAKLIDFERQLIQQKADKDQKDAEKERQNDAKKDLKNSENLVKQQAQAAKKAGKAV